MPQIPVFFTDLDGTLAGNAAGLRQFTTFLAGFDQPPGLVYVTGRHLYSALELIDHDNLPHPDMLITDIGTAIYTGKTLCEDPDWRQHMQYDWQPEAIRDIGMAISGLAIQELPHTKRVSFVVDHADNVRALEAELLGQHIPHQLIYSADSYLDVLPRGSGKGQAVTFVLNHYYNQTAEILIAGDTGNDADMLELGYPSVIVGNSHPELHYLVDRPHVYKAAATHAAGIQEGWEHHYGSSIRQA